MTNKTIFSLGPIAVPLAGTEFIPIWNGTTTEKVAVSDLTAGRVVNGYYFIASAGVHAGTDFKVTSNAGYGIQSADGTRVMEIYNSYISPVIPIHAFADYTFYTSNLVQGTAAKGINFTANTPAAGMTSQLLNWYEEGTWTTTVSGIANFTGTPTLSSGKYTRTGRKVTIEGKFSGTVTTASTLTYLQFTIPTSRSATTDGGSGSAMSSSGLKSGNVFNAGADITTAFLVIPSTSAQPSGADTFFFSYTYNA